LITFKYYGGDNGILERYFYNPTANKLVEYMPENVAPNLITLVGFGFSIAPFYILFGHYGTNLVNNGVEIPNWFYYFEAFSYLAYRMLDEMDGKQARKTGNGSPLGLLFDHGCDSMSMGLQCLIMTKCLQAGNGTPTIIANILAISSFHFSTLEEYYCGGLYLGVGNGVTDGSAGIIAMFIYLGMFGNAWTLNIAFGTWTYA
jgi:ethanolaminephosphotransferase